ncbi:MULTISPECIES: hypothetical protein [Bacillus]|uniref:hypothetical protein n=1 Tax=Bacillus TaxID=1386 RepID=UPI000B92B931|nr:MULTISPECIES: hypothetical protein [Bacillus]ASS63467.1 hypothetical protein CHN56_03008 [Bacillus velezensis]ATC50565.1 hypothetical protein CLI97_01256 [Bacillus velezensis]MCW5195356.1 hypothetical protein [Bacillus amyloliquefaciens]MCX2811387.1 hypothetical protein [Bacillus sp. ChL18]QOC79002.1 hypothetical protein ID168_14895 [Bacillus velezensis]
MDQFISTIIFTIPGLICYYWLQLFGLTPNQKHNPFEMLGISVLLWIPVSGLSLITYNILVLILNSLLNYYSTKTNGITEHFKGDYIGDLTTLNSHLTSFSFIAVFFVFSLIFSYCVARIYTKLYLKLVIGAVNKVRRKRGLNGLSKYQTVWEEIFVSQGQNVVELSKIDNEDKKIIGDIEKVSRPLEPERNFVLRDITYFTELVKRYNLKIEKSYIDVKAGIKIGVFKKSEIKKAQIIDNESDNPIED